MMLARIRRLAHLPPNQIFHTLVRKVATPLCDAWERYLYLPTGKRFLRFGSTPLRSLQIIHPDVFSHQFAAQFRQAFPQEIEKLISDADKYCNLVFDCLGSGPVDFKEFNRRTDLKCVNSGGQLAPGAVDGLLPWHFDFKAGVGWDPRIFYSDIRYGQVAGVDVKVPWELSRCQHLVTLGQAYRLTGNEKYARAFVDHVSDWIDHNPVKYGVNWTTPMDIALRACNWLLAKDLFSGSPALTPAFDSLFSSHLKEHGHHIIRHLEWGGKTSSNHYLSNLIGLIYIGFYLDIKKWREFGIKELSTEMERQIYTDGFDYEASTGYFRLVLEIFFFAALVAIQNAPPSADSASTRMAAILGPGFPAKLAKMFNTLAPLLNQKGDIPLIGDNDSGRVHVFERREDRDMAYLLAWGALLMDDDGLRLAGLRAPAELVWLFGFSGKAKYDRFTPRMNHLASRGPGDSGLVVMSGETDHFVFSAQPNGMGGFGSHTHNDKLSFTLSVGGEDFFIDPGTAVYTPHPGIRNRFRGTGYHNTLMIDDAEQNRIDESHLFLLADDAKIDVLDWRENTLISCRHSGYARLAGQPLHTRTVTRFSAPLKFIIKDDVSGSGEHRLRWNFIVSPQVELSAINRGQLLLKGRSRSIRCAIKGGDGRISFEEAGYAPRYGVVLKAKKFCFEFNATLPQSVTFELEVM